MEGSGGVACVLGPWGFPSLPPLWGRCAAPGGRVVVAVLCWVVGGCVVVAVVRWVIVLQVGDWWLVGVVGVSVVWAFRVAFVWYGVVE